MPRRNRTHPILVMAGLALLLLLSASSALAQYGAHPRIHLTPERLDRIRTIHWQANSYEWDRLLYAAQAHDIQAVKAQALVYAVTQDESWAQTAIANMLTKMEETPDLTVSFNSVGRIFNGWALGYDWLYNSPHFTPEIKQQIIDYISQVPKDGPGKWNWYPDHGYFNGVSKMIWGQPLWGMATWGDNPLAQEYIDNAYENRWIWIRNSLGYGPANLAVVRGGCMPQGVDYAAGTMSYIVHYLAALKSATGEDLFDEAPAIRQYLEYFIKSFYYSEDFIRRPEHGHNAHKRGGYLHDSVAALLIIMENYSDTPEAKWASWWLNNIEGADRYPGTDYRYFAYLDVIYSDPSIPQVAPTGEDLAYFAEGNGMWIARSDWATGSAEPLTFATFRAGNWTWFNQNHWDQGNYCIYSHGEDLLVDGGLYEGAGGFTVINYHHQTIAHNCITVKDPEQTKGWHFYDWTLDTYENSGGQNRPYRETIPDAVLDGVPKDPTWPQFEGDILHDMSDVTRRSHNERYTYAFSDMTNAYANPRWEDDYAANRLAQVDYRPKVSNVTRHWFYLRSRGADEDEYFVAFDRVSAMDADFQKKSMLHFIGEPQFTNGSLQSTEVSGHIETWSADRFEMELGGAVLHGAMVLPADARIRKVGGTGYEYWVNDVNYDAWPDTENELGGQWRLEIMPPTAQRDDLFLTVLHPDWIGAAAPEVERVPGNGYQGAAFDGWVTMFADEEVEQSETSYVVNMDGTQRHLVADMQAGYSYRVYRNGNPTPLATITAGTDGIVEFESPGGGSFQVSQGDFVPDDSPPTGSVSVSGDDCQGDVTVTLQLDAEDEGSGVGWMRLSNDGTNWSDDLPYQEFWSWTITSGDGPKTVYALYGDIVGNWMTTPVSGTVTLDDTPPSGSFSVVEDVVETGSVTLSCSASESGCAGTAVRMSFSNNGSSWSAPVPLAANPVWDLNPSGEGSYTVYARYIDGVGNWSDPPLSDTVLLDLPSDDIVAPVFSFLSPTDGATDTDPLANISFRVEDLGSDVDLESITLTVNGEPVSLDPPADFGSNRYLIFGDPDGALAENTIHNALATASDLAYPPNTGEASWTFTTGLEGEEAQPPAPPTGFAADLNHDCNLILSWDPSSEPNVVAYRVSWGIWPDGEGEELPFQTEIGASLADLPEGDYWLGVFALNSFGQESAVAGLPGATTVACGPGGPGAPGLDPDFDALGKAEIWPPGVLVDFPETPLSVANLDQGWTIRIFTVSGRLVYDFVAETDGEDFTWNLLNQRGSRVAKGLYLVRVFDLGGGLVRESKYIKH